MKHKLFIFIGLIALSISCGKQSNAHKFTDKFFECRKAKDYDCIKNLLSNNFLQQTPIDTFIFQLKQIDKNFGRVINYKSTNFEQKTVDKNVYYIFDYQVDFQNIKSIDKIVLIKENDSYKVDYYSTNW